MKPLNLKTHKILNQICCATTSFLRLSTAPLRKRTSTPTSMPTRLLTAHAMGQRQEGQAMGWEGEERVVRARAQGERERAAVWGRVHGETS